MPLDEALAITLHLTEHPPVKGVQYKSSLIALLGDARGAAERNARTGKVEPGKASTSWLAAAAYMVLLDQIGTCFKLDGPNPQCDNPIARALLQFSKVREEARLDALYALRNALAHDYSLFNPHTKNPSRRHAFNFTVDMDWPLVQLPKRPWSGSYDPDKLVPPEEVTTVNLRKVGDLVEGVVTELKVQHLAGRLQINPSMTVEEFHMRYGMSWRVIP